MPTLRPGPADRELQRLIEIFLKAETDIINEIGRLRSRGLIDYGAVGALERVQAILRKLENDCWTYVPRMLEEKFYYVNHPDARKPMEEPETPEKHLRGYQNARALTSEQTDIVQRLTMNLMGEIDAATATVTATLQNALIGRIESDIFRRVGLEQAAAMQATGRGVYKALPQFVEVLRREGITAFVDRAGRHWSLHTYGSMVLRTTSRQAEVLSVLTENPDHDLYKISSHGTTCKLCAPLEGRVYSKSGTDPDFPPLAAAFGKVDKAGPDTLSNTYLNIHPSCLHSIVAWTPMGRSPEELRKIKDFSSFEKNPVTQDPRTKKQIEAYRKKEEARARFLRDYRQWERYRLTIPDDTPKTFATFQRHKQADDDKYKRWEELYREANNP
ncbi:MAG: minor capsid protein [Oscillibacter sp.]|nr:minor capsid protein [Oscillibacter sp.]